MIWAYGLAYFVAAVATFRTVSVWATRDLLSISSTWEPSDTVIVVLLATITAAFWPLLLVGFLAWKTFGAPMKREIAKRERES